MVSILDTLGRKYGTDKSSVGHDYLRWYEPFFAPFRDKYFNFLEMGVGGGGSLQTWRDYFPLARIVGFDITEEHRNKQGGRIDIVIGDQSEERHLDNALDLGPFSIVNDDAGHHPPHQISAMRYLLPRLIPGGLYVLEDIGSEDVTGYLTEIALRIVHGSTESSGDEWIAAHGGRIEAVSFYREACVIKCRES